MKKIGGKLLLNYRYLLLIALVIVASVAVGQPLQNILNVITMQAPYVLIYAFGMTVVMLTGGLDLSQGSVAALSTCLGCMLIIRGHLAAGFLVTLLIGAAVGLMNGLLVTKLKVPSFITTYGMDWVARGLVYIIMSGTTIFGFSDSFKNIAKGTVAGIPNLVLIALITLLIMLFLFQKTTQEIILDLLAVKSCRPLGNPASSCALHHLVVNCARHKSW